MKKIFFILISYIYIFQFNLTVNATIDWWILWDFATDNTITRIPQVWTDTVKAIRFWDIHLSDIPIIIKNSIDFFIGIAWTIAIIFVIIWSYQIVIGSLSNDKTKWKETIIMALTWFVIASLAWFIIKILLDNLW